MKHASTQTIKSIDSYLTNIRKLNNLKEKKEGVFYKKGSAYLHFHEDENFLCADLKINEEWNRFNLNSKEEWDIFLNKIIQSN